MLWGMRPVGCNGLPQLHPYEDTRKSKLTDILSAKFKCVCVCVYFHLQVILDESQVHMELQMALDSKDSDIEQLRCQLTSLSIHSMDSTSISSGNDLDKDDSGYPGKTALTPLTLTLAT